MDEANLLENIVGQENKKEDSKVIRKPENGNYSKPSEGDFKEDYVPTPSTPKEAKSDIFETISSKLNLDTAKLKNIALNFIVPIVSLGVSLLLIIIIIVPSITNKSSITLELSQKQTLQNTLTQKLTNLDRLVDFKAIVDEDSVLINKVLVSEEMVPELLSEVDHLAKSAGFEVTRLSYSLSQAKSGTEGYPAIDVSLGVKGTYDQFVNFLKLTENAARLVDLSNFRYSVGSKEEDLLNFNIVLVSPYLYVNSEAVTDDMIDLDITSGTFLQFMNKLKSLRYYDPAEIPKVEEVQETQEVEVVAEEAIPSEVTQ